MPLPNVSILLQNGQLGSSLKLADGVAAIIGDGTATTNLALSTPTQIFGTSQLAQLGVTEANNPELHRHVTEFYLEAGEGAELWIMIVPSTMKMNMITDLTEANGLVKLLAAGQGRIRIVAVFSTVTGSASNGLDGAVWTALTKAQALAEQAAQDQAPIRILLNAFNIGTLSTLTDLKTMSNNRVGVVIGGTEEDEASVGLALGRLASIPVQRKMSRVKDGALQIDEAYLADDTVAQSTQLSAVHDKGYIVIRAFPSNYGYYWGGDHMATADTDDFASMARGRVIDKAHIIAYLTFLQELDNEVPVENGLLSTGYIAYLEGLTAERISLSMSGEISSVVAYIDPAQNILATNKLQVVLKVTPVGYSSDIEISLGFNTI